MPSTLLFAINSEGRVFGLSSNGTKWREFIYLGLEFKQLSAVPNFLWAVGGDRQIYVHAYGLDFPIRVKEESYENERWIPFEGFSKKLLPTDRYNFSNQDGTSDRNLKKIRLPSMAWQWEGEWKLELTYDGQPLDHDGWTYAVDFSASYCPKMQWASYVRRRKWVRYRKYIALNSWCAIAPLHKDPTKEPFIGVAVGGNHLPGCKDGLVFVWAVTACGRVMFRTDVSRACPEGQRWSSVTMPPGCEVNHISVGATGLVWVVLRNGKALVRTGITRECFTGNSWIEVEQPEESLLINQISIGYNSLWAITRDFRVWFRKGIYGESAGISQSLARGSGWVEMFGNMSNISVASNDQVWAVGAEDKTSVTQEDLMGKTWRALGAPTQLSRATSSNSFMSGGDRTPKEKRHRSWASLNRHSGVVENLSGVHLDLSETCHSAPPVGGRSLWLKSSNALQEKSCSIVQNPLSSSCLSSSEQSNIENDAAEETQIKNINDVKEYCEKQDCRTISYDYENFSRSVSGVIHKEVTVPTRSWSPQHAGGTVVAPEAHYAADSIVFESDEMTGIYSEHGEREDEDDYLHWADTEAFWSTVEAGACLINVNHLPNWFSETSANKKDELVIPWRIKILNELKARLPKNFDGLQNYEKAVESSAWSKSGQCKILLSGETSFKDCNAELEWICGDNDNLDCSILTLSSINKQESWAQINIRDVTAVISCSVPQNPRISLYSNSRAILKLQFGSEDECEEWKSELSMVCCRIKNISGPPSSASIWVTSITGEIYVCDLLHAPMEQHFADRNEHFFEKTFVDSDMPIKMPLQSGFSSGASIIIRGFVLDNAKRFALDFICSEENGNTDVIYHFNLRFDEGVVVQNSRKNLVWGQEKRSCAIPFQPGKLFKIEIARKKDCFITSVDGKKFTEFSLHKNPIGKNLSSAHCTHLCCHGDINVRKIYSSTEIILETQTMFWRHIDGHLKKVESAGGVTWGIGFDNTAWLYLETESSGTRIMHDSRNYYVYENQRWNPFTGYTSAVLPTDSFMWSDVTGKQKRTREKTCLMSKKWRWVNDWSIDFHTPGGVDKEGWQYAIDFLSSFHGTKNITDYVRRRRWFRSAKLETAGPWVELGYTPLSDCSLHANQNEVMAWAVAVNGSVLFRKGVSKSCPAGLAWEHVSTDEQILSISCGPKQVGAICKSGTALFRIGITESNPMGNAWETIEAPVGPSLKQIAVGDNGVWALDACGKVLTRGEISTVFPFGSHWRAFPLFLLKQNSVDDINDFSDILVFHVPNGFRQIAAKNKLWGITTSGHLVYRLGATAETPTGFSWILCIEANFLHTSA